MQVTKKRAMTMKELNERIEKYLKENGPKVIREYEENGVKVRVFERV